MSKAGDVDVFISYTQSDYGKYAEPLARYLRDAGIETWIAPERLALGDGYPQELTRAIEACTCLVVIVSQAVAQSKHVAREVTMALEANRRLIGIKVDSGQVPDNVRYCLATCHLLDASTGLFEVCVQKVIDQLRTQLSAKMAEVPPAVVSECLGMTQVASEIVALWRRVPEAADILEFSAPDRREFEDGTLHKRLAFPTNIENLNLGRRELAHKTVSRRAVCLRRDNGRVWLKRDAECSAMVHVGLDPLEAGQERLLIHDRPIVIGRVEGRFIDHRYRPVSLAPVVVNGRAETLVDERTGLLSRAGILRELAHSERKGQKCTLVLLTRNADDEYACRFALALHADNPQMPVARWDQTAAVLAYGGQPCLNSVQQIASGGPLRVGQLSIPIGNTSVLTLLADASAALERVLPAAAPYRIADLQEYWLSLREPEQFVSEVEHTTFLELGIMAIEDFGRLAQFDPAAAERLERELLLDLSHELGTEAVFSRIVPGVIAFTSTGRAELVARQVASHWRERGPVQGPVFEIECQLAFETIPRTALSSLVTRAQELAFAVAEGITAQGLPYPIAVHAHTALEETGSEAVVVAAERFGKATEQFVYLVLCALYAVQTDATPPERRYATWRELGESVVPKMFDRADRIGEFARSLAERSGKLQAELSDGLLNLASLSDGSRRHLDLEHLRAAVKQVLIALKGLRRWTLATVERFERLDPFSDRKSLQYMDHTGPSHLGIRRQATLVRDIPLGPFVYLVRLPDAAAFPLEPFVRRRLCAAAQEHQLLIARQPLYAGGEYQFVSPQGFEQQDHVDARQLPRSLRIG